MELFDQENQPLQQEPAPTPVEEETQQSMNIEPEVQPQQPSWAQQVEQKNSPFAASPYESTYTTGYTAPPPKAKKPRKPRAWLRRIVAGVLMVALVAGACAVTAEVVNSRWEKEHEKLQQQLTQMQDHLQQQIDKNSPAGTGDSVSGSPVFSDRLTPSQVYARNVKSVVGISTNVGTGTGFIISADGYVLSNYHVVEGADRIRMVTHDNREYSLQLVGYYQQGDVALLKAEATGLQAVTLGSSDDLIVGDMVAAVGNPLGELTSTLTVGYVSGKDRLITTDGTAMNMIQTDAAINAGNSGGPLFNMKGEVIGITTAKYSGSSSSGASIEGLGFAIPIGDVKAVLGDLMDYGYVKDQAHLGVMVYTVSTNMGNLGCCVDSVTADGPADKAGIRPGDIIVSIDGNSTATIEHLSNVLTRYKAGQTVRVTILRNWQQMELTLTFGEKPQQ